MTYDTKCTFTLGQNNKGDNPKRPDYRGELIDDQGRVWSLSAWKRFRGGDKTKPFLSGKLSLKTPPAPQEQQPEQGGGGFVDGPAAAAAPKPAASDFI
jgi:hypothetical protein